MTLPFTDTSASLVPFPTLLNSGACPAALNSFKNSSQDWTGATAEVILQRFQNIAEDQPDGIVSLGREALWTSFFGRSGGVFSHVVARYSVVEESIQILKKAEYRFVTVSECTGITISNPCNCEFRDISKEVSFTTMFIGVPKETR